MDFVNEGKLDDEIKRRQAEWERVRTKDDPVEAPPEVFDNRTLFDKLKEQHEIKKKEFEDQYALKNLVRGVDEDESDFLNEIDHVRSVREKQLLMEENKEVEEAKKLLQNKSVTELADIPKIKINLPTHKRENKQADLLAHAVVAKRKLSSITLPTSKTEETKTKEEDNDEATTTKRTKENTEQNKKQIVVGVLPGLGEYDSDSSSDSDSSDEDDSHDHTV